VQRRVEIWCSFCSVAVFQCVKRVEVFDCDNQPFHWCDDASSGCGALWKWVLMSHFSAIKGTYFPVMQLIVMP